MNFLFTARNKGKKGWKPPAPPYNQPQQGSVQGQGPINVFIPPLKPGSEAQEYPKPPVPPFSCAIPGSGQPGGTTQPVSIRELSLFH